MVFSNSKACKQETNLQSAIARRRASRSRNNVGVTLTQLSSTNNNKHSLVYGDLQTMSVYQALSGDEQFVTRTKLNSAYTRYTRYLTNNENPIPITRMTMLWITLLLSRNQECVI